MAGAIELLLPAIAPGRVDILCVAFGVNDTTAFRRHHQWLADLGELLRQLHARVQPACILLAGVPPLQQFPALPWPLRSVLGMKAASLDRGLARLAKAWPNCYHVPMAASLNRDGLMASDGYHPSAAGCTSWASWLAQAVPAQWKA